MAGDRDAAGLRGVFELPMPALRLDLHSTVVFEATENLTHFHGRKILDKGRTFKRDRIGHSIPIGSAEARG